MTEETAIVPVDEIAPVSLLTGSPANRIAEATEVANALAPLITSKRLYVNISGKKHVLYEGWTTLGALMGVFPKVAWTHPLKADQTVVSGDEPVIGWEARVEAVTLSGAVVGAAESQCLRAESNWKNRDDFALRSMAQTRAGAKALRMPLGFIMALAGYDATPADEMPREAAPAEQWKCKDCRATNTANDKICINCERERGS